MTKRRVLVVTYFWPPSGKATVHWPLSMSHYLPELGWTPVVLTIDRDTFAHVDMSLGSKVDPSIRVVRARSFEPFDAYRKFLGKPPRSPLTASEVISREVKGFRHRLAIWIRMNLFVPDARVGWYWSAIRAGQAELSANPVHAVISVGPPHTAHLVAQSLAKRFSIPHIPVLIDPWADIVYYRGLHRNALTVAVDRFLERSVMRTSAAVVFVTKTMRDDYVAKYPFLGGKASVLHWGYDEDPFRDLRPSRARRNEEILLHAGNIFDYQNPRQLWKSLQKLVRGGRNIRIVFVGTVSPGIRAAIEEHGLRSRTEYRGFLPYREMLEELARAKYLMVCATEPRHVPGKLFEYLRTGKPILAFGDDNREVEEILAATGGGVLLPFSAGAEEFFRSTKRLRPDPKVVRRFERSVLAAELSKILLNVVKR
jgi:glycosyltransferase involved in cell wall biosynthesis